MSELERQGMTDVVLYHPNTYNHTFVEEADPLFEGDFVVPGLDGNAELEELSLVLTAAVDRLAPRGRLAVISFHSLEDRIVKRFFKSGNHKGVIEKDFYGNPLSPLKPVSNQVITPSLEEVSVNPAARSAKLRVAEKVSGGTA